MDPTHYITAPALAWDAMLKMTNVELELLTDPDMHLFFEKGIRGGVSTITNRYSKANNKYMKNYNPNEPSKFIEYLDANNLYGWAMSQKQPVGSFKWLSDKELEGMMQDHSKIRSCTLEVDLEYPDSLHDEHNDYPLAPETIIVNETPKLIPNLNDKQKYVLHYETMQTYLKYGLKLTKIHRGVKYQESDFLSKYIDSHTKSRTVATNDFEKDFFKLMNNSVFGKTMENVSNRAKIKIVNGQETKTLEKLIAKPYYRGSYIFEDSELVSVRMGESTVMLNKPIYLGQTILDISKTLMYKFHYEYVKPKYSDRARLLFTDTDSLCYELKTEDFYSDIAEDVPTWFDTSNYPKDHPSGIPVGKNKKVLGMMKDEAAGAQISEFVGLRSKLYAYKMDFGKGEKKCKGVKKNVVKDCITFDHYKTPLFENKTHLAKFNILRSRRHEITTECITKVALSANDDKRHIIPDDPEHRTLALGHYSLV